MLLSWWAKWVKWKYLLSTLPLYFSKAKWIFFVIFLFVTVALFGKQKDFGGIFDLT
jgi:hypothetical protein